MRGSARIISRINCGVFAAGAIKAGAVSFGTLPGSAEARGMISAYGSRTKRTGLMRYLSVTPIEPQQLVWLVPQYGVDYDIISNTNWNIK